MLKADERERGIGKKMIWWRYNESRNNGQQRRWESAGNLIVWVQKEPPRPAVQSHFVVKSLAGGLSPTWLPENNRLSL